MMPRLDGLELCRWIRARSDVPVIMLTALGEEADRIMGLELGADDYVTKPFSPRELTVRVRSVLRRAESPPAGWPEESILQTGELEVDVVARVATLHGEVVALTQREFELLAFLMRHPR